MKTKALKYVFLKLNICVFQNNLQYNIEIVKLLKVYLAPQS